MLSRGRFCWLMRSNPQDRGADCVPGNALLGSGGKPFVDEAGVASSRPATRGVAPSAMGPPLDGGWGPDVNGASSMSGTSTCTLCAAYFTSECLLSKLCKSTSDAWMPTIGKPCRDGRPLKSNLLLAGNSCATSSSWASVQLVGTSMSQSLSSTSAPSTAPTSALPSGSVESGSTCRFKCTGTPLMDTWVHSAGAGGSSSRSVRLLRDRLADCSGNASTVDIDEGANENIATSATPTSPGNHRGQRPHF
mmetsp:Transcript_128713/g.411550  ORF Transcript_128713/g.411550 Transcript_128713/m.411550 type:complete len:249 (-) Transcript_128713:112-858(-)